MIELAEASIHVDAPQHEVFQLFTTEAGLCSWVAKEASITRARFSGGDTTWSIARRSPAFTVARRQHHLEHRTTFQGRCKGSGTQRCTSAGRHPRPRPAPSSPATSST